MYVCLHIKSSLLSSQLVETYNFPGGVSKNVRIQNFIKILLVRGELFCTDGLTDTTELIVACHSLPNALIIYGSFHYVIFPLLSLAPGSSIHKLFSALHIFF